MTAEEVVRSEIPAWIRNDVDAVTSHFAHDAAFDIESVYFAGDGDVPIQFNSPAAPMEF